MVKDVKRILTLALCFYLAFSISATMFSERTPEKHSSARTSDIVHPVKTPGNNSKAGTSDNRSLAITPEPYELFASDDTAETFSYAIFEDSGYESFDEASVYERLVAWTPFYAEEYDYLGEEDIYDNMSFDLENAEQLAANRVPGRVIIKFRDPRDVQGEEKQLQREIDKIGEKVGLIAAQKAFVVQIDDMENDPNATLNRLKNNRFIEYVEPDYILEYSSEPNDPYYKTQSAVLKMINAPAGWDIATGKNMESPLVAVVDSGIASHSDLPLFNGLSSVSNLAYGNDKVGHGTNVAGTVGAIGDNGIGVTGINWNANILAVKVDDASGTLTVSAVSDGINKAADYGVKIINLSLGTIADSTTLKAAIDYAHKKGCAIFAAAGNSGAKPLNYPARYSNVMSVGATTDGTSRASWSNYGEGLDVIAPGVYYTTSKTGGYASVSGTSFSSPQVAGLASLILAIDKSLTNDEVYSFIRKGARPLGGGYNEQTGYGIIDIRKTLDLVVENKKSKNVSTIQSKCTKPPVITLKGFTEVILFVGDKYQEMGYSAVDCLGSNITGSVVVANFVNIAKAGIYTVTYSVTDKDGNTAKVTRTVTVRPVEPPTITIIGSNPIILHLDSGTPYIEQSAKAVDTDGKDISGKIQITGTPDRNNEGTYTVTYNVTGKDGGVATATRTVRIIGPYSKEIIRTPYNLSGQANLGGIIIHKGIVADNSGWMDFKIESISNKMTIGVFLTNSVTRKVHFNDTFSAAGSKQYNIGSGTYELMVFAVGVNGIGQYAINLLMPEIITEGYAEAEAAF